MKIDIAWNMDYLKKAISLLIAVLLSFGAVLSGGSADVLPAGAESAALTQTQVVLSEKKFDPQTQQFDKAAAKAFLAPGLAEGFVPQGIAYSAEQQVYLISGYFDTLPSMIAVLDKAGTLLHAVTVLTENGTPAKGHFGGIAVFRDYVYLANTSGLLVLSLRELLEAEDGGSVAVKASFATYLPATSGAEVANGMLWLTEFTENAGSVLKDKEPAYQSLLGDRYYARADGYALNESAPFGLSAAKVQPDVIAPTMSLAIPQEVQGMTVLPDGKLVFSCSYGRKNDSYLMLVRDVTEKTAATKITCGDKQVPLYLCSRADRISTFTAPPMMQELTIGADGALYILAESGAAKYRCDGGYQPTDYVLRMTLGA